MVEVGEVALVEAGEVAQEMNMESMVPVGLAAPSHGAVYSAARGDEATAPNQQ